MPKEKMKRFILKYNGLFDLDGMYAAVIDWSKNYGYMWHEADYKQKPNGELEIKWIIDKHVTEYISYYILFKVHIWDLVEEKITVDGKEKNLSKARMYIWIDGTLIYDWQNKFGGSKIAKKLGEWYISKVYVKEFESIYGDQFHYRMLDLHALLKKYFDMQSKKYAYKGYLGEN